MRSQQSMKSSFLVYSTWKILHHICSSCHQEHRLCHLAWGKRSHGWACCRTEVCCLPEISTFQQPTGFVNNKQKRLMRRWYPGIWHTWEQPTWFHSKHNWNGLNKNKEVSSYSFLSLEFQLLSCTDKTHVINLQSILVAFDTVVLRLASPSHPFSLTSWKHAGICRSQLSSNIAIILPLVQPPGKQTPLQ